MARVRRLTREPWFGPKRHVGWGWRVASWQGWLVTLGLAVLVVADLSALGTTAAGYLGLCGLLVAYVVVVVLTGDPPGGPSPPSY